MPARHTGTGPHSPACVFKGGASLLPQQQLVPAHIYAFEAPITHHNHWHPPLWDFLKEGSHPCDEGQPRLPAVTRVVQPRSRFIDAFGPISYLCSVQGHARSVRKGGVTQASATLTSNHGNASDQHTGNIYLELTS